MDQKCLRTDPIPTLDSNLGKVAA
ncbi:MAG: hypothetical protein RL323_797, partial [Pseudomonadota bacterium]